VAIFHTVDGITRILDDGKPIAKSAAKTRDTFVNIGTDTDYIQLF